MPSRSRRTYASAALLLPILFIDAAAPAGGEGSAVLTFTDTADKVYEGGRQVIGGGQDAGSAAEGWNIDVPTDARGTWVITYTVGKAGTAKGGGIWLKKLGWWDFHFGFCMQADDPKQPDYVTCRAESKTGKVTHVVDDMGRFFKQQNMLHAVVGDGHLVEGDRIILTVGDRSRGGAGSMTTPVAWPHRQVFVQTDTDGDGEYGNLPQPLYVSFMPERATHLVVVAPSMVEVGESFKLQVRAEDVNSNLDPAYHGSPRLQIDGPADGIVEAAEEGRPPPFESGITWPPCRAKAPGVYYITAGSSGVKEGMSNPIRVVPAEDRSPRLYWGDTHVHTFESDGTDDVEQNYRYARDVSRLDFCCMSDHLMPKPDGPRMTAVRPKAVANGIWEPWSLEQWWAHMCDLADRFHAPDRFVTYYAYEWSGGSDIGGDHIPLLTDRVDLPAPYELNDVYAILKPLDRGDNVFISPHVGGRIGNWDWHCPGVEAAAEVASVHGHFEWFGQEALRRGYKVAFMGAGDNHYGRPGYSIWARFGRMDFTRRNYGVTNAISGVNAESLTRPGIIKGFRSRRVVATTGHRPLVDFRIDDTVMGGEATTARAPVIRADVWGTAAIDRIDLIRNQQRIHTHQSQRTEPPTEVGGLPAGAGGRSEPPTGLGGLRPRGPHSRHASFTFTDDTVPPGRSYYYLRIRQRDGELAWASPIFVEYTGEDTNAAKRASLPAWNDDGTIEDWLKRRPEMPTDYTSDLERVLAERAPDRFGPLNQVDWVEHPQGDYAVFLTTDRKSDNQPIRIRYWSGFTDARLHVYPGLADYGPIRK